MDKQQQRSMAWQALRREKLAANTAATILTTRRGSNDTFRITSLLANRDPVVRLAAVSSLVEIGGANAADALARHTSDASADVRTAACKGLGKMRAHWAKAKLYDSLHDNEPRVRCAAADALAAMGDNIGLAPVVKLVSKPPCVGSKRRSDCVPEPLPLPVSACTAVPSRSVPRLSANRRLRSARTDVMIAVSQPPEPLPHNRKRQSHDQDQRKLSQAQGRLFVP